MLIGGQWVQAEEHIASINPATGEQNHLFSSACAQDVDAAVRAAQEAARGAGWRDLRPHQRAAVLRRMASGMDTRREDFARLQMLENGKVLNECRRQAASAAATFNYYASVCETLGAEVTPARGDYLSMTHYEPYGVVACITPWNSPLTMEAQKVAPALAAGNTIVLKPSEQTPSTALLLGQVGLEAGLPPGVLNVITGLGREAGQSLVAHPQVRLVSFTGGTESGRAIAAVAASKLMPVALELGGKSPHIVFDDAAIDDAIEEVVAGIFEGCGQSCVAGSRLYVQRGIAAQFMERLAHRTQALKLGLPDDDNVDLGPVASFDHRQRIEQFVAEAVQDGAEILVGGRRPDDARLQAGAYYLPTILTGLHRDSRAVKEEIFGPVLCAIVFDDEDDLLEQANDSVFGLAAGVWTKDYQRALRVAYRLEAGTVWINTYKKLSISTPFGGYKQSGMGREKGISGMRLYQQVKSLYLSIAGS